MKVTQIVWNDHFTLNGWVSKDILDSLQKGETVCSVGYLVKETRKIVVLAQSLTEDSLGDVTVIIKSCIVTRDDLWDTEEVTGKPKEVV